MKIRYIAVFPILFIISLSMLLTVSASYKMETATKSNSFTIAVVEDKRLTIDWVTSQSIQLNYYDEEDINEINNFD